MVEHQYLFSLDFVQSLIWPQPFCNRGVLVEISPFKLLMCGTLDAVAHTKLAVRKITE